MARLNALDVRLEQEVQRYDLAKVKLDSIQRDVRQNRHESSVARRNLKVSERTIAQRLVTLYTSEKTSTIEVILGARSLDEMISRLNAAKSVTSLDDSVLGQVKHFRTTLTTNARRLRSAKAAQSRVLGQLAAERSSIESQMGQERRLAASLKSEIARMEAAAQARQIELVREAQARLAAQRAASLQVHDSTVVGITAATPDGQTYVPPSSYTGVVAVAMAQLGKPYVWAAEGPDAFDCSGLVAYAYAQVGVSLPHSSYAMWGLGVPVSEDQLEPGDLVFFEGLGHVGMYIGGGSFIHAPHTGTVVQITSLASYQGSYVGARRIL